MNKINLQGAKKFLEEKGFKVFYVAVYGSQNYLLDTEDSDVDYKAIILPSLDDLIQETKPFSSVFEFESGQIDVKDIRAYIDSAVKCNINFIEILVTDHWIGDDSLRRFHDQLLENLGFFFLKACFGMMKEKEKALRHPYPGTIDKINRFGYDPKQLHHIIRLGRIIEDFCEGYIPCDYKVDEPNIRENLIEVKKGAVPNWQVDSIVNEWITDAKKRIEEYTVEPNFDVKYEMINKGRGIIKQNILLSIKKEYE